MRDGARSDGISAHSDRAPNGLDMGWIGPLTKDLFTKTHGYRPKYPLSMDRPMDKSHVSLPCISKNHMKIPQLCSKPP